MKHYLKNITTDSITGMILAMEGINGAVVLLNGPMGCKFYHSTTSQFLNIRPMVYVPGNNGERIPVDYNYLNSWFFRQPRVPCTYLDSYDYVYGTTEKVEEGLVYLKEHLEFSMLAIVNSPGASLIGDDLRQTAERILPELPVVVLESPGYSLDFAAGYSTAMTEFVRQVKLPDKNSKINKENKNKKEKNAKFSVNILGLSIWNRYFEGDREELKYVLGLCGIEVNCFACAGASTEEMLELTEADLNLVIDPERGLAAAKLLEELYGMPYYACTSLPIGFDTVETMCRELCRRAGTQADPLLEYSERSRALAWYRINDIYRMCGRPRGVSFALEGSTAQVEAYSAFFMDYLGMVPDALSIDGTVDPTIFERLKNRLSSTGEEAALERDIRDTGAELVFAEANTIAMLKTGDNSFCGIEINLPGMGYTDIIPKTHMGIKGALFLIEQVLNGMMSKLGGE